MYDVCQLVLTQYASDCPNDPDSTKWYVYGSDGSGNTGDPTASYYFIYVDSTTTGFLESKPDYTWAVCSNGKVGLVKVVSASWADVKSFCGF